jgi:hypothetical protein
MRSQSGIPEHHLDYQRGNNEDGNQPALPEQDEEDEED